METQLSTGSKSRSKESSKKKSSRDTSTTTTRDTSSGFSAESLEEFYKAKAFLMKASTVTSANVYDHLKELIGKILEGRPDNVVDYVEEMSVWLKKSRLQYREDTLLDSVEMSSKYLQATKDKRLFHGGAGDISRSAEDEESTEGGIIESVTNLGELSALIPNLQNHFFFLEQAGITLNRNEVYRINLSIIKLIKTHPIYKIRFWGKIIGIERNYVILETEFHEGDEFSVSKQGESDDDESENFFETPRSVIDSLTIQVEKTFDDEEDSSSLPSPKPKPVPTLVVPSEPFRVGANQKVYFAALSPEFAWVKLPLVTPVQISTARMIQKYFIGRFEAPVLSYPPFPGREIHLLRAQIARISASTHISPNGYYDVLPEDNFTIGENLNYERIPVANLVENYPNNWVHHSHYLLPQGRCTWAKPEYQLATVNRDDEEEEDVVAGVGELFPELIEEEMEPETGPPLLSTLADDSIPEDFPLWTAHMSPTAFPNHAVAVMKSLLWPGAYAITRDRELANVYIGYGTKYATSPYNPAPPPPIMNEYPGDDIELLEAMDPSPEEEAVFKQTAEGSFVENAEEEEEVS
uniref:Uncharacterized protein n=1 Tax=Strigamia maritima TaxID=126957 RepID=T1IMI0_STRMM